MRTKSRTKCGVRHSGLVRDTEKTVSLNQRYISLIYGQRKNFFELKKVLLIKKKVL